MATLLLSVPSFSHVQPDFSEGAQVIGLSIPLIVTATNIRRRPLIPIAMSLLSVGSLTTCKAALSA